MPSTDLRHLGDFDVSPRLLAMVAFALPIGALSAGVAWCLLRLIGLITNLVFYQRVGTALVAPGEVPHSPFLILLAPIAGGLVIGLVARFGSEKIRGHGIPEAIQSILTEESRVQPRVALLKPLASAIAIGTGGPFGAEGPIIMTGGAVGSITAQHLHLTADERKTLLVAGAAAGMAATFDAPLASLLLAVELLLFEWRPRSFIPVAAAVAIATIVRIPLLGSGPIFPVPTGSLHLDAASYALCVVSGAAAGALALLATSLVYLSEDAFGRLPIHWMWWPAIGGLIIGIGGLIVPQALGVGYDVIEAELNGHHRPQPHHRHPDREDADLVPLPGLGDVGRRARPDADDRRRARRPRGADLSPRRPRLLAAGRPRGRARRGDALTAHRRRLRARADPSL